MIQRVTGREIPRYLIYMQLVLVIVLFGIRDLFGITEKIKYIFDLITIALIPMCFYEIGVKKGVKRFCTDMLGKGTAASILIFTGIVIFTAVWNKVPLRLFIWAVRNTYRYIVFFAACVLFLNKADVDKCKKWIPVIYGINFLLSLMQFGILGLRNDYVGGIFGVKIPCNTFTNLFLCIVLIIVGCEFMEGKCKKGYFAFIAITSMIIAAMAELKVFYVEFVVIVFMMLVFYWKSERKYWLLFYAGVALLVGMVLLYFWYPEHFRVLTNLKKGWEYIGVSEKSKIYYIGRLDAFKEINKLFFGDSIKNRIIGLGFGNCEGSSLSIFTGEFYRKNEWMHYRWFVHQMLYMETGYLGFISFVAIFAAILMNTYRMLKSHKENTGYLISVIIFSVIIILNMWYNYGIRNEIAYLTYFILAIPRILSKEKYNIKYNEGK